MAEPANSQVPALVDPMSEDVALTSSYEGWLDKGPAVDGVRLTIMSARLVCLAGEPVRIVHIVDHMVAGRQVYVMGPKPVYGEHVNGALATAAPPTGEDPLEPMLYDGPVLPSPRVDANYQVTVYVLPPGGHEICWRMAGRRSNLLRIQVRDG